MLKKKLILSTAFLPPAAYFRHMASASEVWMEKHEHYVKQSYRNRCTIYAANGPLRLTIPVTHGKGEHVRIEEVTLSDEGSWKKKLWKSIQTAYRTSPFFEYYEDEMLPVFMAEEKHLFAWNRLLLDLCCSLLGIEKKWHFTESYLPSYTDEYLDLRAIHPKAGRGIPLTKDAASPYTQVFSAIHGFIPHLSILDVIFHLGPGAGEYVSS